MATQGQKLEAFIGPVWRNREGNSNSALVFLPHVVASA